MTQLTIALVLVMALVVVVAVGGTLAVADTDPSTQPGGPPQLDPALVEKAVTTDTGLRYIVIEPGDGAVAEAGKTVAVHYTGWLEDGTKFDSSRDRGSPIQFPLGTGRVIKGWDEGVAGMKVGEQRRLIIPPDLAYGPNGAGGVIPPNATLTFDVELMEVD